MIEEDIPLFSEEDEKLLERHKYPFCGIFGDTPKCRVVEELMADPSRCVVPEEIAKLTELSVVEVEDSFESLTMDGLLYKCKECDGYTVNYKSRRWVALTLLAFAGNDDFDDEPAESSEFVKGMEEYLNGRTSIFMPFSIDGDEEWKKS